jgi:dCMP deaminase
MGIALAVRERANCLGRKVGAIIVLDGRIISTGYNGTPAGTPNCTDAGCYRCAHPGDFPQGQGYDLCICVHAEQNALIAAARFGIALEGSTLYSTVRPCFGCSKELLQAKVLGVRYLHDWTPQQGQRREQYERLQSYFPQGVEQVNIPDPRYDWAMRPAAAQPKPIPNPDLSSPDETGHRPA